MNAINILIVIACIVSTGTCVVDFYDRDSMMFLQGFIAGDDTNENTFIDNSYMCIEFTRDLINATASVGCPLLHVHVDNISGSNYDHTLAGFIFCVNGSNYTDEDVLGLYVIEPQSDEIWFLCMLNGTRNFPEHHRGDLVDEFGANATYTFYDPDKVWYGEQGSGGLKASQSSMITKIRRT